MKEEVVPRSARFGRLEATGEVEVAESPAPTPTPTPFVFANVLSPPNMENDDVRGLRFVVGLTALGENAADPPPPPPRPFDPFPLTVPAIRMGSVPLSVVVVELSPLVAVVLLPIDIPKPFPFVSPPSLTGSLTDTTANLEG